MHDARERERDKKINADDDGGDDVGDEKPRSSSSLGRSAIVHALRSQQSLISNSIGEKGVIEILGGEETRRGETSLGRSIGRRAADCCALQTHRSPDRAGSLRHDSPNEQKEATTTTKPKRKEMQSLAPKAPRP